MEWCFSVWWTFCKCIKKDKIWDYFVYSYSFRAGHGHTFGPTLFPFQFEIPSAHPNTLLTPNMRMGFPLLPASKATSYQSGLVKECQLANSSTNHGFHIAKSNPRTQAICLCTFQSKQVHADPSVQCASGDAATTPERRGNLIYSKGDVCHELVLMSYSGLYPLTSSHLPNTPPPHPHPLLSDTRRTPRFVR